MKAVGLYHCFQALSTVGDESERQVWAQKAVSQRTLKNAWKRATLKRPTGRDMHWRTTSGSLVPTFPLEGSLGASDF